MTEPTNGPDRAPLSDRLRTFLSEPHFATIASLDPDGSPRQALIWFSLDGEELIINSAIGRRWPANLVRDRRASLAITDTEDGYAWIGLIGRVDAVDEDVERAREDIVGLAHRYHPDGPSASSLAAFRTQPRITFRIAIDAVHDHLED